MKTYYDTQTKPLNDRLGRLLSDSPEPSKYDTVDFDFIHDEGFAIIATSPIEGGYAECEVNEDYTIGEALDALGYFIKQADRAYEWYLPEMERI